MNFRTRNHGFSLLELLLALIIVGVAAAAALAAMRIAFNAQRSVNSAMGPLHQGAPAVTVIQRDIESALPPTGVIASLFVGSQSKDDRGNESDDLLFNAAVDGPRAAMATDIRQIEYAIEAVGTDHVLVRKVTSNVLGLAQGTLVTPDEEVICRGVQSFVISYSDGVNEYTTWDSTQDASITGGPQQTKALPVMVTITLTLDPPDAKNAAAGVPGAVFTRSIYLPCSTATTQSSGLTGATP